jgi:ribonuclease H2 subunit A
MAALGGGQEYGCGYPSDPATVAWLHRNMDPVFGYPDIVRFSWSSCDRILQDKAVPVEWPDEAEEDAFTKSYRSVSAFCGLKPAQL